MNAHTKRTTSVGPRLVSLTFAAALATGLACSDSGGGSPTGKGGSGGTTATGHGGTTGSAGTGGTTGSAGTGGSTTGTAGTGGNATGTAGGNATGTAGTGGNATGTAGTGGNATGTAGTGGNATGTAGTGGNATGTAGTGGTSAGGTGGSAPWLSLPANLPPTLNPPANATLKLHLHAVGDQIYTCTASAAAGTTGTGGAGGSGATTYSYVLKQPDAKLYDQSNTQVGTHGMGPNWTSTVDNSVVNGAKAYGENASGTIQWLLLRATSNSGTGAFGDVTFVIRANTSGGVAPATGCDSTTAGTDTKVAYMADYYFFSGGNGSATIWNTPPANLPAAIAVPSGATVKSHDHAIGVQVYTCTASTGGTSGGGGGAGGTGGSGATTYSWVLKQPDAVLYDSSFAMVGTHGMGPNWTSTDGSIVVGTRVNGANGMTGAVPWLLLQATSNTAATTGPGAFGDVTYIQRLNTAGGPAPATGCDSTTVGNETRIPYSADYYFFTGGVTTDGGTNG